VNAGLAEMIAAADIITQVRQTHKCVYDFWIYIF
jgi:hypothetical protein